MTAALDGTVVEPVGLNASAPRTLPLRRLADELGRRHAAETEERLRQRARDLTAKVKELEGAK